MRGRRLCKIPLLRPWRLGGEVSGLIKKKLGEGEVGRPGCLSDSPWLLMEKKQRTETRLLVLCFSYKRDDNDVLSKHGWIAM